MICIKNGTLHTAVTRETFVADILIDNGKIVTIGKHISSENAEVIDVTGLHVYPGFIDAHCHTGLDGYGIGYEGQKPVLPVLQPVLAVPIQLAEPLQLSSLSVLVLTI